MALAIYITYIDIEEIDEDETPTPSYFPFLDEEPMETALAGGGGLEQGFGFETIH